MEFATALPLAAGLGLLGFVEPCSVGSHLLFIRHLERLPLRMQAIQTLLFTLTRAALMAGLGVLAALIGSAFTGLQHGLWAVLGSLYVGVGLLYLGGGTPWLLAHLNRLLPRLSGTPGSLGLGVLFGLNVPACAAPLLAVLLGDTAARAAAGGGIIFGATTLLVFGLALSSPLVLAVYTARGRRWLEALARLAGRMPRWTGAVLVGLGAWTLWLAFSWT
ncbi:cytochrome c biogenesis protein CcdA [Halomonas sp. MMSF_3323]|uniref:cytochrome c biogenesis protein CcdA n=1 Tax=Halomonas sp. MMSF_3323 TaxID=3046701 RepID=UPI00273D2890|nr:cytochrome c biogenesis protein CcdA [Halomonas sp. MMSF_3323]